MRILHFPANVGGHPWGVSKAERKLGIESKCVLLHPHPQGLHGDRVLNARGGRIRDEWYKWCLLLQALLKFDAVHFNFGMKFFTYRPIFEDPPYSKAERLTRSFYRLYCWLVGSLDLFLLKVFRKKIYVTFQGDDARMGVYCRTNFKIHFYPHVDNKYYSILSDQRKKALIRLWDKYADEIFFLNPDLGWILPPRSRFFAYGHINIDKIQPAIASNSTPVIVHAPTHRLVKGTQFVLDALNSLKEVGVGFELKLVEGLSFAEAMEVYKTADIVVDQVLAGWYGGFAVEAMALGKPVISYIREEDLRFIPVEMRADLPIVNATPETLPEKILELINSSRLRKEIGERGREFVRKWHSPARYLPYIQESSQMDLQ